jgi:vacuolar-type H+-ATPase subunit I/STV1
MFVAARRNIEISKFKLQVQQSFRDTQAANDQLDKAKKNFLKAKNDVFSTQAKLAQLEIDVVEFRKLQEEKRREKEVRHANVISRHS